MSTDTEEIKEEIRVSVKGVVGWIPEDIMQARAKKLEGLAEEAERLVKSSYDPLSQASQELLKVASEVRHTAKESKINWKSGR